MKKLIAISVLTFMFGCSEETLIQEDLEKDVNQLKGITDEAFDDGRGLDEDEDELFEDFRNKYFVGKFSVGDDEYEMNDLEKEIVRNTYSLQWFTESGENRLESDTPAYETQLDILNERLTSDSIPEELEGKHPTYERQEYINKTYLEDAKEVLEYFKEISSTQTVTDTQIVDSFIRNYDDEDDLDAMKVDDTLYFHNSQSKSILYSIRTIYEDVFENERINDQTIEQLETKINDYDID